MIGATVAKCGEEVGWRADRGLARARSVGDLADLLGEIEGVVARALREERAADAPAPACAPGCSGCCTVNVGTLAVEGAIAAAWLRERLAPLDRAPAAARLLVEQAAAAYDGGERCDMEAGMAKLFASEAALENATEAMRIHGAYGYSKEFNIERYYRDAPLMCIGEGTNEMQRIIIARQLVARNPV